MGGPFDRPVPPTDDLAAPPGLAATARDCAAAGPRAADYATYRVADDIDAIRRALGEQRISMLGVSYGTVIADRYARRYDDHVDRFVLDSVVGPGPDGRDDWHAFDLPRMIVMAVRPTTPRDGAAGVVQRRRQAVGHTASFCRDTPIPIHLPSTFARSTSAWPAWLLASMDLLRPARRRIVDAPAGSTLTGASGRPHANNDGATSSRWDGHLDFRN